MSNPEETKRYYEQATQLWDRISAALIGKVFIERAKQDEQWGGMSVDVTRTPEQWSGYLHKQLALMDYEVKRHANAKTQGQEAEAMEEVFGRLIKIAALSLAAIEAIDNNYPGIGGNLCDCAACQLRRQVEAMADGSATDLGDGVMMFELPADGALGSLLRDLLTGKRRG